MNADLALYSWQQHDRVKAEECLPEHVEVGKEYPFLKRGHRNYEQGGEVTLLEMRENEVLFDLRGKVVITHSHFVTENGQVFTKGNFKVKEIFSTYEGVH